MYMIIHVRIPFTRYLVGVVGAAIGPSIKREMLTEHDVCD